MKVRITNEDGIRWYKTGEVYEVDDNSSLSNKYYEVVNTSGTILKNHCKIISEKYTYLDVNLPEWWDGSPIYGVAWGLDGDYEKYEAYCFGIDPNSKGTYQYICRSKDLETYCWYKNFKPIIKQQISAKVVVTKDGKTTEVELTAEQIEKLGIK